MIKRGNVEILCRMIARKAEGKFSISPGAGQWVASWESRKESEEDTALENLLKFFYHFHS